MHFKGSLDLLHLQEHDSIEYDKYNQENEEKLLYLPTLISLIFLVKPAVWTSNPQLMGGNRSKWLVLLHGPDKGVRNT